MTQCQYECRIQSQSRMKVIYTSLESCVSWLSFGAELSRFEASYKPSEFCYRRGTESCTVQCQYNPGRALQLNPKKVDRGQFSLYHYRELRVMLRPSPVLLLPNVSSSTLDPLPPYLRTLQINCPSEGYFCFMGKHFTLIHSDRETALGAAR